LSGKTIPKDCIAYHHALFNKDNPELLDKMRSGRNRHVFVEERKPAKKQASVAAASRHTQNTSLMNQQLGGGAGFSNHDHPLAHQARAGLYPEGLSSSFGIVGIGGQIPPHMEADLILRRRLDEAMHHSQNNNNHTGYSTSQADQLEPLRCGGGSYSPQTMGGIGCDSSMEVQRMIALRQQQQQQQQQGMVFGGGVDLLTGCNGEMSYNSNNSQDNNQAHFMAMRQLLVDQRAAARATEESLRLHQLLSMQQQGGGSGGNVVGGSGAGGGAADFAGNGNNSSAQDAKFYQLMRLRQQLDMVARNP
jgi:hypothetical protein